MWLYYRLYVQFRPVTRVDKSNANPFDNMRVLAAESKMREDAKHLFNEAHWDCLCQEAPKPAEAIMLGAKWSTVRKRSWGGSGSL